MRQNPQKWNKKYKSVLTIGDIQTLSNQFIEKSDRNQQEHRKIQQHHQLTESSVFENIIVECTLFSSIHGYYSKVGTTLRQKI